MTPLQENKVIKDLEEAFKELKYLNTAEEEWLARFKDLSSSDIKSAIKCFERSQSTSIVKGFHSLDEKIYIPKLGVYYIKPSKLDLAKLIGTDPVKLDPTKHAEVIKEIKRLYLERRRLRRNKSKTLHGNFNSRINSER